MGFTREEMAAYEKQPQTQVADTQEHLLKGATPSKAASADAVAAVKAGNNDATPPAKSAATDTAADPSDSGDGESGDQTVTGTDGTSDENADSSTASAEPGSESESDTDGEGVVGEEAPARNQTPPKKGSAAARIQELNDLMDGYKEFGKHVQIQLSEALAENARLKSGGTQAQTTAVTTTSQVADDDDPMPDLADADVNFDTDKLRAKTQKWHKAQIAKGVHAVLAEREGKTEAQQIEEQVHSRVNEFAKTHPDWEVKVAKNPVLMANQLAPAAARVIGKSEHVADILYAFGNDPALAIKTSKQPVEQQIVTVGKLIAKIEASKEASGTTITTTQKAPEQGAKPSKQKSLTQAPPPPSVTKAAGRADPRDVTDPNMDMDEFARRHREGKQAGRAASRKARGLA